MTDDVGMSSSSRLHDLMVTSEAMTPGEVLSYGQVAERIAHPRAQRAVGTALSLNDIGYLIPCHRVIQESGRIGQYRWKTERKLAMQAWE